MKKVAVVIPTYSENLSKHEMISLQQLCNVLKAYDKFFVAPEGLNCNYGDFCTGMKVAYFSKNYFKNTITYSLLLLAPGFYKAFSEYEYILIHQLDVFVFADKLLKFCDLGFDYIGAPALKYVPLWHYMDARVGNGGLSLRKVSSCQRILEKREFFKTHPFKNDFLVYEDTFFGFAGNQPELDFKVADFVTARKFALQDEVQHVLRGPVVELPFGVHGWQKINTKLWTAVIKDRYGYDTSGIEGEDTDYRRLFVKVHLDVRKVINVNFIFGCLRNRKVKLALNYFLDWQETVQKPKNNLKVIIAFLQRLANYSKMMQLKEKNSLPYKLLAIALEEKVSEWK